MAHDIAKGVTIWYRSGLEAIDPETGAEKARILNHGSATTVIDAGRPITGLPAEERARLRAAGVISNQDDRPDDRHPNSIALDAFKAEQAERRKAWK